ncbi:unnamed protein product, partial [Rotaria sordida]
TTTIHSSPNSIVPSQPGHRIPVQPPPISSTVSTISSTSSSSESISSSTTPSSSTLLAASSTTPTPTNVTTAGEYNPFASNILTTSIVDVLTKPKELVTSVDETNSNSTTKMNFANVAKMNVPTKSSHHESILITMDESLSPPPDPKIAPGYRGPSSTGTTPIHQHQHQHQHQQQQQQ